ncbi:HPr-rel-A system PqqD family peptide chaperone [bacterium]|nr:HPr-rel-A system PqqD family peptide chaperone [bacterium]
MSSEKLKQIAISERGFIFNPLTGDTFTLNPTALFLIQKLKENLTNEEAIEALVSEYEVDKKEALEDFELFYQQLEIYGLI